MIIFVMLMKISLARHEVYKEMELVLKKVCQHATPWIPDLMFDFVNFTILTISG